MNCINHSDREQVAFCQNCGKPLCRECTRPIGTGVFCEPCLAARLAAADTAAQGTPYGSVNVPPSYAGGPVPAAPGAPNPVLAGALGLIPGVGAMYNGQYAKGIVHLVVFALLVSLADNNGVFGLFVAGWVFYQVIEAYHTARARRDGTAIPNPFGLNDIGDRLGFGKTWPAGTATAPIPPAAPPCATPPYAPPAASWGAPTDSYAYAPPIPPIPPAPPYAEAFVPVDAAYPPPANRFPTGAVVLIALGLLFFFGSSGLFAHFPVQRVLPFLLIGLGVWILVHKMTRNGTGFGDDGSPDYRLRLFRALRGSVWVMLVGVLFLLDSFDILTWGHSWPLFIILGGLMTFFERSVYGANYRATAAPYPYPPPGPSSQPPYPPASTPTSTQISTTVAPLPQHDDEGR